MESSQVVEQTQLPSKSVRKFFKSSNATFRPSFLQKTASLHGMAFEVAASRNTGNSKHFQCDSNVDKKKPDVLEKFIWPTDVSENLYRTERDLRRT